MAEIPLSISSFVGDPEQKLVPMNSSPRDPLLISFEKWLAILALAGISALFGLIPYTIFHRQADQIQPTNKWSKLVLTTLSSLTGGILLSTTVIHILPEVREKSETAPDLLNFFGRDYPIAEILMLSGFCLIYLFEEFARLVIGRGYQHFHFHGDYHHHHDPKVRANISNIIEPLGRGGPKECYSLIRPKKGKERGRVSNSLEDEESHLYQLTPSMDEDIDTDKHSLSALRAFISLIALSFHAVMEGIAVGLQSSSDLWFIFGAVASHKFLIAFCLGMELVKSQVTFSTFLVSTLLFSIVSPLGMIIGSTLSSEMSLVQNEVLVVIEGLACGTLLYVVFFEILTWNREHSDKPHGGLFGLVQFFGTFAGILLSTCLVTLQPHNHEDPNNSNNSLLAINGDSSSILGDDFEVELLFS